MFVLGVYFVALIRWIFAFLYCNTQSPDGTLNLLKNFYGNFFVVS